MSTHPRRRLAIACTIAGTLACSALAGPAMAADDAGSPAADAGKAGAPPWELTMRKSGGDTGYIIAVL